MLKCRAAVVASVALSAAVIALYFGAENVVAASWQGSEDRGETLAAKLSQPPINVNIRNARASPPPLSHLTPALQWRPSIVSLWSRRLVSQPDVALFLRDAPLRALVKASRAPHELVDCLSVEVSSFLVVTHTLRPVAQICHLKRQYCSCSGDSDPPAGAECCFFFSVVRLPLDNRSTPKTSHSAGISSDPQVQEWMEQVVGPLDLEIVAEQQQLDESASQRGRFSRRVAGFSVYDHMVPEYLAFIPTAAKPAALRPQLSLPSDMFLGVKLLHDKFWGVQETFHKTLRHQNHYVFEKGLRVRLPVHVWQSLGADALTKQQVCSIGWNANSINGALHGWWSYDHGEVSRAFLTSAAFGGLKGAPHQFGQQCGKQRNENMYGDADALTNARDGGLPRLEFNGCLRRETSSSQLSLSRVVVTGDSQSRSLYRALRDWCSPSRLHAPLHKITAPSGKTRREQGNLAGEAEVVLSYEWDNYLSNISRTVAKTLEESPTGRTVVVVAGMGAHPASWGQHSYTQYSNEMQRVAHVFLRALRAHPRLRIAWYGAPAWPKPKSFDNFRITNIRLGLFNYLALEQLEGVVVAALNKENSTHPQQAGVVGFAPRLTTVDFFGMTLPVLKWSIDGSHFDKSMVMAAMVQDIADKAF